MADYCNMETTAFFRKSEIILTVADHTGRIGILQKGEAHISWIDDQGGENISEILMVGDCFGEYFRSFQDERNIEVIADSDCEVRFINVEKALGKCQKHCDRHAELLRMLVLLFAKRAQLQDIRILLLSQRTLRDKLLTYLRFQQMMVPPDESFEIPMSLGNLAGYLCVDRSAMMREIRKMKEDGLIESRGRHFRLTGDEKE